MQGNYIMHEDTPTTALFDLPELPIHHLPRKNYVKWLKDRLSVERKVIVIKGAEGSGKTTLIKEFIHSYPDQCFSFFMGADYWSASPNLFLHEMCDQMRTVLGEMPNSDKSKSFTEINQDFMTLYREIGKQARRNNKSYYFVIDGLDLVKANNFEISIIQLLPYDPPNGVYLIASSKQDTIIPFKHEEFHIQNFSYPDTEHYLSDLNISQDQVKKIYDACDGMPGYLAELRSEVESGKCLDTLLQNLPIGFRNLLERKWDLFQRGSIEKSIDLLAIIAFSNIKVDMSMVSQISGNSLNEVAEAIKENDFLIVDKTSQSIEFSSDAHKKFVSEKLINRRESIELRFIKYLETKPYDETSINYLPELYKKVNDYEALKNYITSEHIIRVLQTKHDLDVLYKNLKIVSDVAYHNHDWQNLSKYSILCSILKTLSTRRIGEGEIDALLSLGDVQNAINRADQAILPEDKLQLLAKICYGLKKKEIKPPDEITRKIEDLVLQVEPKLISQDRVIDIAADLFHVNPNAASELLRRVGASVDGKMMDIVLAVLSIRLDDEPNSAVMLSSMISNNSIRDIAKVNSPIIGKLDPDEVIFEAKYTTDVSMKLYILRSWCNVNRKNPKALKVVEFALEIMTNSTEYSPSMRHLRQIAEPLLSCKTDEICSIIERIDILKNTAIVTPADEKVRLELLLASIETTNEIEGGITRIYQTYLDLDNIPDLDIRCYCRARFLISYPNIKPGDTVFIDEIRQAVENDFYTLTNNSAYQFDITKKIFRAITSVDPYLALAFAERLNTIGNRDKAYYEIMSVYLDYYYENINLTFLEEIINSLSEKEKRDWAIVILFRNLSEKNALNVFPENCRFIEDIKMFNDPCDQCYAYSYIATYYAATGQFEKLNISLDLLYKSWERIDKLWVKVEIGFNILSIIGERANNHSKDFYSQITKLKNETPLAEATIVEVYINTITLLIRTLPDILKSKDSFKYIKNLNDAISLIPSFSVQSFLFSKVSLYYFANEKKTEGESYVKEKVIKCLESISDIEEKNSTIVKIAPALYLYERTIFENEIMNLSLSKKELAIFRVIQYLLSKRSPDDPVDLENLSHEQDHSTIFQVLKLIKELHSDWVISRSIELVIDVICTRENSRDNHEIVIFIEKISLTIANQLKEMIDLQLPDKENISHNGYKLLCQGLLIRLRSAALRKNARAKSDWYKIAPTAKELIQSVKGIDNLADKAFLMARIGAMVYFEDSNLGISSLELSKDYVLSINNQKDRTDRLTILAESWNKIHDSKSSLFFLKEAFNSAQLLNWDPSRDAVISKILEIAHSIDPEFASSLTSTIDNPISRDRYNKSLQIIELHNKPNELDVTGKTMEDVSELVGGGAYKLLESFCTGRGYAQSEKVVCDWLKNSKDSTYKDAFNVYSWAIENNLAMNKRVSLPQMESFFSYLLENLELIRQIGETLSSIKNSKFTYPLSMPYTKSDLEIFYMDKAMKDNIERCLSEFDDVNVKIYDAYFSYQDLAILKYIKSSNSVYIFTLWKTQRGVKIGDREIEKLYKSKWSEISDQPPPTTNIYIVGIISNGDGPIHDRYILGGKKGISIGTSIGGTGNKDSGIHILKEDEITKVDQNLIFPLMSGVYRSYKEEKLEVFTFML